MPSDIVSSVSPTINPAPVGSYTTEHWPEDATGAADGIDVVHSTASNTFALTGVVIDGATGEPVPGASAMIHGIKNAPPCAEPCIPIDPNQCDFNCPFAASTTSDSKGAFAFINMPNTNGGYLHLTVNKTGYGSYTLEHVSAVELNNAHVVTVSLSGEAQMYDAGVPRDENPARLSPDDWAPSKPQARSCWRLIRRPIRQSGVIGPKRAHRRSSASGCTQSRGEFAVPQSKRTPTVATGRCVGSSLAQLSSRHDGWRNWGHLPAQRRKTDVRLSCLGCGG